MKGKGIITKSLLKLKDYLINDLNLYNLVLRIDVLNAKSQNIALKTGF